MGKITTIIIAAVVASLFLVSMFSLYGNLESNYDFTRGREMNKTYDKINGSTLTLKELAGKIYNQTTETTAEDSLFKSSFNAARNFMRNVQTVVGDGLRLLLTRLVVPDHWITGAITIITLIIIITVIAGVLRHEW